MKKPERQADDAGRGHGFPFPENVDALSPDEIRQLIGKLRAHETELEMQNEKLRQAQREIDAVRERYFDLYDLAPVSYCTVSETGTILEANLTAASLLGLGRSTLVEKPFTRFLVGEDADNFHLQRKKLLETGEPLACELQMVTCRGKRFWAHLAATVVRDGEGLTTLRIVLSDISRLKKVESALHRIEAFNRAVLDSLNAEIAVLDREGTIIAVNQAWRRFAAENSKPSASGTREPLVRVGVNYLAVCEAAAVEKLNGGVDSRIVREGIQGVLDGRLPSFGLEYPCHSPEEQRWFSMNVTPMGDGAVISHTNITRIKQLEEETKASSLYSRNLLEAIQDPLITISSEGRITDVNKASEVITGMSRDALIGSDFADYCTDPENVRAGYQLVLSQGYLTDYPIAIRHVSGKITDVLANANLCHDAQGNVLGVFATVHDITERKRTLEKLREQKEFFHLIAENISDFIVVLDLEGRRLYNSPSYTRFFGSQRDLRGSDSFVEVHADDKARVRNAFNETVKTGRGRQLEYRLVISDGSVRTMESRGSVIRDSEGQVARVVVVSHDITERKRMENQVRQMAFHDALTQLPNRRLLNDRLNQTMAASTRSGYYGAVMFLDLDNFKPLNDKYGHDVGDLLLIEVAVRLKSCVREMDTVARFGGDEFVVMISELSDDKAESVAGAGSIAEKIRLRLAEPYRLTVKPVGSPEHTVEHRCSATIGVVVFIDHEASPEKIIKQADIAMYQAKERGRNMVRIIDLKLDTESGT